MAAECFLYSDPSRGRVAGSYCYGFVSKCPTSPCMSNVIRIEWIESAQQFETSKFEVLTLTEVSPDRL
jgi:hypothetical protein